MAGLEDAGLTEKLVRIPARDATRAELRRVHSSEYLDLTEHHIKEGAGELSTGDTVVCVESWDAAVRAAGLALGATEAVMKGRVKNAFCAVRPPGHHATGDGGMGFCIFNNVALAARHAQKVFGIQRVLIVDWDVHHGNGTQDIFYSDPSVFFFSTHQSPWYPGTGAANETGEGAAEGMTLNCPFPAGSGRDRILGAFHEKFAPRVEEFRPDLVLISAGFDSRAGDPLGRFLLTDTDFADLTAVMLEIAHKYAGGRLISVLEGGYDLNGLARAVSAHAHALSTAQSK
jgi:acetoin utilization deacetylase AcuC-like enzyme